MKLRTTTRSEPVQHKMHVTDLDHSRTGFYASFLALPIATGPPMPRVRALHHPAFLQGCAAVRALWPCLHCEVPPRMLHCHPGCEGVMVILRLREERDA